MQTKRQQKLRRAKLSESERIRELEDQVERLTTALIDLQQDYGQVLDLFQRYLRRNN